ncbi:MAG TPA: polyprenyl synthetase family protein [Planctomycetes bacterium]|nr:polyprenyl synthetase family protein [Fuerstiella sp.]HIK92862.1 polyprenyl synthetase family protein [Planctomycetota bacterium]
MSATFLSAEDLKTQLRQHLARDLQAVNRILAEQLRTSSAFVSDITEHVSRYRGKQLRPMLLLLIHRMIAGEATAESRMLAAAIEMIHTATLVHDDVIDEADMRRHVATVHRRWNTETSVLLGDYLFSRAFQLAASTGDAEACRLIGLATNRTCEGELNQMAASLEDATSEIDYFRIVRDKTGQLFGLSCLLGSRAGGGNDAQQRTARRFGLRLGMAFQIADDVLDLNDSGDVTGKDAGNDLQNNRQTLPVIRAIQLVPKQDRPRITQILAEESPENLADHEEIQAGIRSARDTANALTERAIADLARFPVGPDRSLLQAIASFAVCRDA